MFQLIRGIELNGFEFSIKPISKKLVRACRHLRAMQKDPHYRAVSGLSCNRLIQWEQVLPAISRKSA